jgi:hypothetical protein
MSRRVSDDPEGVAMLPVAAIDRCPIQPPGTPSPNLPHINVSTLDCLDNPMPSALPSLHLGAESGGGDAIQAYAELVYAFWSAHRRAMLKRRSHKEVA